LNFEEDLIKLKTKLMNKNYAIRTYASLCNVEWLNNKAPSDWRDYLKQKDTDWEKSNAKFWRKLPRLFFGWIRKSIIIPMAYPCVEENGKKIYKTVKYWSLLNIKLMKLEYKFWVFPEPDPKWLYSCSWRYAGGIIAEIRNQGEDYMDFFCSSGEGIIDLEFAKDMKQLGWIPIENNEEI